MKHQEIELLVIHIYLLVQVILVYIWEMNIKHIYQEMVDIHGLKF